MQNDCSNFKIPSFERQNAYNFDENKDELETYRELNAIHEEIEKCRLRNM